MYTPITTKTLYPYTSGEKKFAGRCKYVEETGILYASWYRMVGRNHFEIKAAISQMPVSAEIAASSIEFRTYSGKVITGTTCGTRLNHSVVIVGYGDDPEAGHYYLIRNSWGSYWGENGYAKIGHAEGAGVCGINYMVGTPWVRSL